MNIYADTGHVKNWNDRSFEVGVMQTDFGFSGNLLNITDIFQELTEIDQRKLHTGFFFNLNFGVTPLYFSYNRNKDQGIGFYLGVDASGLINLSERMFNFSGAISKKSDFVMTAFAYAQFSLFFHISKLKFTLNPAVFYPAVFVIPSITYTKINTDEGLTTLGLHYDLHVFSSICLDENNYGEITGSPGFDLGISLEYPLAEVIGIKESKPIFDFSVGIDLYNFALIPAALQSLMRIEGSVYGDDIDSIKDSLNGFALDPDKPIVYSESPLTVRRPFKILAWAQWRPFKFLSITPAIGFSVNNTIVNIFSFEGGLKADLNILNAVNITAGVGYYDRVWINSVDLAVNFKVMEFNAGLNLRSNDFAESWNLLSGNLGARIGFKIGY